MDIIKYNAICNLGSNIDEVFQNALLGRADLFCIENKRRIAKINVQLPTIEDEDYNIRCNQILLKCIEPLNIEEYDKNDLAVVCATTNTGVNEYEKTKNPKHFEIGNPAEFIHKFFKLKNFYTSVSTACSSGIKAFLIADEILNSNLAKTVLVINTDAISKLPLYGFHSLEILDKNQTNPFSKNRKGINIGEAAAAFILQKQGGKIKVKGMGETTDCYHSTTPDPNGIEAIRAIKEAMNGNFDVDYINLHGTGTIANDLMEAVAISSIFGNKVPASSTKPLTGHCLGAAAGIEIALCAKLLENGGNKVFPHIYDGFYDETIPKIFLAEKNTVTKKLKTCLCTSFGFGGTNTAILLGVDDE